MSVSALHCYTSSLFAFDLHLGSAGCTIEMQVHSPHVTTDSLPQTKAILEQYCPSVLHTKCYNYDNLPFDEEVTATEVGHLFEHILLDFLCDEKVAAGASKACYNGTTSWNWTAFPHGSFTIKITHDEIEAGALHRALQKTIQVVELILESPSVACDKHTKADSFPLPALVQ